MLVLSLVEYCFFLDVLIPLTIGYSVDIERLFYRFETQLVLLEFTRLTLDVSLFLRLVEVSANKTSLCLSIINWMLYSGQNPTKPDIQKSMASDFAAMHTKNTRASPGRGRGEVEVSGEISTPPRMLWRRCAENVSIIFSVRIEFLDGEIPELWVMAVRSSSYVDGLRSSVVWSCRDSAQRHSHDVVRKRLRLHSRLARSRQHDRHLVG